MRQIAVSVLILVLTACVSGCASKLYAVGEAHTLMGDTITHTIGQDGAFMVRCEGNCRELSGGHGSAGFYGFIAGAAQSARKIALTVVGVPVP
jgi:hypothetical protein